MHTRRWLLAIWICFLIRGAFYSAALPLWEGFDEWAHFAVIQRMALHGEILVSRNSPVSREIEASLQFAPVPWELRKFSPPSITGDIYWRLPPEERGRREAEYYSMPASWGSEDATGGLPAYEALQPPLYYWIMAPLSRVVSMMNLGTQVVLLRWASVAIASMAIPLCFLVGRVVFRNDALALGCSAIVAVMPEFAIDVARVANDCAAVVLFTLLTWLILETVRRRQAEARAPRLDYFRALSIGVVLGLGLLTKVYFLTAVLPVAMLLVYEMWRARGRRLRAVACSALVALSSLSIAAWWYVRNVRTTGTFSGLSEATMLHGTISETGIFRRAGQIHWPAAIDSILVSHLWFGGWSSMTIRSWMYHLFYVLIALATIGLVRLWRQPSILALVAVYGSFWIGQFYNVLLLYVSKGMPASMGWYMYAVVAAEVALCVAGLRAVLPAVVGRKISPIGVLLFALLDLYTLHVIALRYYTGLLTHRSNGALMAAQFPSTGRIGFEEIFTRLTAYKGSILSEPMLVALWVAYLVATAALVVIGFSRCSESEAVY